MDMKINDIMIISYGMYKQDGPLENLLIVFENIGKTALAAFSKNNQSDRTRFCVKISERKERNRFSSLVKHLLESLKLAFHCKRDYILVSDDTVSSFSALAVWLIKKPKIFIVYTRELNIGSTMPGKGKIFCFLEKYACSKADIIICCNEERANIMQKTWNLKEKPIVLENVRALSCEYDKASLDIKYKDFFTSKISVIETGGIDLERGTLQLIKSMKELNDVSLYIVGHKHDDEYRKTIKFIESNQISNVYIFERVDLGELRYLVDRSQIGAVIYHKNDLNNIYCASGKVYEYIYAHKPIIASENIPLVNICQKYHVGVANDNFKEGINEIIMHYNLYKDSVMQYAEKTSVDMYLSEFKDILHKRIDDMINCKR